MLTIELFGLRWLCFGLINQCEGTTCVIPDLLPAKGIAELLYATRPLPLVTPAWIYQ